MTGKNIALMGIMFMLSSLLLAGGTVDIAGPLPPWQDQYSPDQVETAVFAGGCFWGVEAVYEQLQGVLESESGYSGGEEATASYLMVGTGATGHAESVRILYDPEQISYEQLLEVFFLIAHDPTQLNYQGPDRGSEYRSVVFYTSEEQRRAVETYIGALDQQGIYPDPVVTEVQPLDAFYRAEEYHQDYLRLNPDNAYIQYWDMPKLEALQKAYGEWLRS